MGTNIITFFSDTVKRYPGKTAVIDGGRHITFKELAWQAQKLGAVIANLLPGGVYRLSNRCVIA